MSVTGTVYLICLSRPFKHARHYIGWTAQPVEDRLEVHRSGQGSRMLRAAVQAGIKLRVVRTWEGVDRHFERELKNRHDSAGLCPRCRARRLKARAKSARRKRRAVRRAA